MFWLNSALLALTSVQPYIVPATVIGLVSFAFLCFIIFYIYKAVKILNRLKNIHLQLCGNDLPRQSWSLRVFNVYIGKLQ